MRSELHPEVQRRPPWQTPWPPRPKPIGHGLRAGLHGAAQWGAMAALALALPLGSAQSPVPAAAPASAAAPALPARAATLDAFVPPGWVMEQQQVADFNRDGRPDALLLLRPASGPLAPKALAGAPASPDAGALGLSPLRMLAVVLGAPAGYTLAAVNDRLIPQLDLSNQEDPLANGELLVRPGGFELGLGLAAGVGSYETVSLRYRFRYRSGCMLLIGYDRLQTHRATLDTKDLRINFLTGTVRLAAGNAQTEATQERREKLALNPRRCLQDLGSAIDFMPL